MLDALSEELGEEYKDRILLLVACGTHEPPTEEDLGRILGKYFDQYNHNIKIHDCDANDLVYVGTTSRGTPVRLSRNYMDADIKIITGDITLHYYAGFGGGRKSILPGISSRETIQKNHALLVDEHARTANLEQNPVHLDMSEAASFAPPDFTLNVVAAGNGDVVAAYAGELNQVFRKSVEVAKDLFCRDVPDLFDVLIVSAGGFPKDRNLYQATKAIENCYRAVVPGGKLIFVAECRDGIGDKYFERWMNDYATYEAAEVAIRTNFVLGGHKAFYMRKVMNQLDLSIVSELDTHKLMTWQINAYKSLCDALVGVKKDKVKIGIVEKGVDTLLVPRGDR
jgi:nickel-dependent lactate racemase